MAEGLLGPGFALLSSVTWAIGSSRYSVLSRSYSPFAVNLARALFALPLFVVAAFVMAGGWSAGLQAYSGLRWDQLGWFAVSMIASYGLGDVLFLMSTRLLGISTALAIASSYPLWTAGAARIFRAEALNAMQVAGLVFTVLGVAAVIIFSADEPAKATEASTARAPQTGPGAWWARNPRQLGIALAFLTSLMWALNSYSCSQGGQELSAAVGNTVRMIFALFYSSVLGKLFGGGAPLLLPVHAFKRFAWLFVLEAFGGSYFYMYGLTHSPLAIGATLSSLAPVMAVPIACALGIEKLSWRRTLAICTVVLGISLLLGAV